MRAGYWVFWFRLLSRSINGSACTHTHTQTRTHAHTHTHTHTTRLYVMADMSSRGCMDKMHVWTKCMCALPAHLVHTCMRALNACVHFMHFRGTCNLAVLLFLLLLSGIPKQGRCIVAAPVHAPSRAPLLLPLLLSHHLPLPRVH